jgi:hypothetical protein
MPIIRGRHEFDDHFTQIKNAWLRDDRLTFKARGLLAYIESHSPEWQISVQWLVSNNPEGKEAIRSAISELELHGYLRREQENNHGRFGEVTWTTQEPLADKPLAENPPLKNTIEKNTIDKNIEREQFNEFWALYPKKVDKAIAFRQFKRAVSRVGFETILAGVIRFANDPNLPTEKRYIKNPGTWLNAEAWENGPLPERKQKPTNDWDALKRWAEENEEN